MFSFQTLPKPIGYSPCHLKSADSSIRPKGQRHQTYFIFSEMKTRAQSSALMYEDARIPTSTDLNIFLTYFVFSHNFSVETIPAMYTEAAKCY